MDYRDRNPMGYSSEAITPAYDEGLRSFLLGVYNYMASALALTGAFAYIAANYAPLKNALYHVNEAGQVNGLSGLGMVISFSPLLFIFLNMGINRLSLATTQMMFWAFSAMMGLSLSTIFFLYSGQSIMRVFLITAVMFGSMSIWGYSTKRELTGMGHFLMMGAWGIIIAMVVNMFVASSALQFGISAIGVVVFTGLTAYDTQTLKRIYYQVAGNSEATGKYAILGATNLYFDFINMFLFMLRLMGDRR